MAFLEINGERFYLTEDTFFLLGRSHVCDIVLNNPTVEDAHALLYTTNSELCVYDLDSENGTYVNGVRVRGRLNSSHGAMLRFGDLTGLLTIYQRGQRNYGH